MSDHQAQFTTKEFRNGNQHYTWLKVLSWRNQESFDYCRPPPSPLAYLRHELSKAEQFGRYMATQIEDKSVPVTILYVADGGILLAKGMASGLLESGITSEVFAAVPEPKTRRFIIPEDVAQKTGDSGKLIICEDVVFYGLNIMKTLTSLAPEKQLEVTVCAGRMNTKSLTDANPALSMFRDKRFPDLKPSPLLEINFITPRVYSGKDVIKTSNAIANCSQSLSALTSAAMPLDLPLLKSRR